MDFVKEITEILALQIARQKKNELERMNEILEYGHGYELKKEDIVEGVKLLLNAMLQEEDPMMKRRFLRTIFQAVIFRQGKYLRRSTIDWDPLATLLPSLDKWQLQYALDILDSTGQEKYIPILDTYTQHADPEISKWALRAIEGIKFLAVYDVTNTQDSQKEE